MSGLLEGPLFDAEGSCFSTRNRVLRMLVLRCVGGSVKLANVSRSNGIGL